MSYKFQVGPAILSGSTVLKDALSVESTFSATSVSASAAVSGNTLDIGTDADIDGNLDVGGLFKMADVTSGKILVADGNSYEEVAMSGDVEIASGGATTIQAEAVHGSMLNTDAISGQSEMTGDLADTDELMISDGGVLKRADFSVVRDAVFADVSGDATVAAGGALTIAADAVEGSMLNDNVISGQTDLGSAAAAQGDELLFSDDGTLKKITFSDLEDSIFGNVSGDATIAAGGALTIAAQAVENSMLADDAVGADELAANAVVNGSVVDGALKADKLDLDGSTDIGADLADADLLIVDDGAGGTNRVAALSRMKKYVFSAVSGDATASDSGALTIAAGAVEGSMLNSNVPGQGLHLSGSKLHLSSSVAGTGLSFFEGQLKVDIDEFSALGGKGLHQTDDKFLFSDNGQEKTITFSNLQDAVFTDVSGQGSIADGGALSLDVSAITAQTEMTGDVADADELVISDGGVLKRLDFSVLRDAVFNDVSGDATVAAGGALTIGAGSVEHGMLNDNIISGQDPNTDPQDADLLMLDDGPGTVKKITLANLGVYFGGGLPQGRGDANVDLSEGVNYGNAAITADRTWKLPASAGLTQGDKVIVKAGVIGAGVKITVAPNVGQSIDSSAVVELQEDFAAVTLVYIGSDEWRII